MYSLIPTRKLILLILLPLAVVSAAACQASVAVGDKAAKQPTPTGPTAPGAENVPPAAQTNLLFVGAVEEYGRQVAAIEGSPTLGVEELRRTLRSLAIAIENIPRAEGVRLDSVAEQIRMQAALLSGVDPTQPGSARPVVAALRAASQVLLDIAEMRYRTEPQLFERARGFVSVTVALPEDQPIAAIREGIVGALDRGRATLSALVDTEQRGTPAR
jgi:hypothetical protein